MPSCSAGKRALAERESALSERDDRIAALETAKQEALWRADAADDELGRTRSELANLRSERARAVARVQAENEVLASLKAQEATIEDFRRAAAAHVEEVNRLRDAANEQASLVTELEEALAESEKQLASQVAEVARLQKALSEIEDADRGRRSRLAELEGLMLRAEHNSAKQSESRRQDLAEMADLRARMAASRSEADQLRVRLVQAEEALAAAQPAGATVDAGRLAELESRLRDSDEREARCLAELEARIREYSERERRLAELRAEAPDPEEIYERLFDLETQYQAATMAAARVPALEAKLAELETRLGQTPGS
jgi:chromosome segregation ATPase